MSDRISIDLTMLADAGDRLRVIAADFDTADATVDVVTAAIGGTNETRELRHAVEEFAATWRLRREKVRADVHYLAEVATAVASELECRDQDLASQVCPSHLTPSLSPALAGQEES